MGQKILVTGSDGFIGSHLVESLVKKGYNVKAFVLYNSFNSWGWLDECSKEIKKNVEIFIGDTRDPQSVKTAVSGCEKVLHLASLIGIPYSYYSPDTYIDTNIKGTLNILNASRDNNISKIIHTSTSEVYGTAQKVPIDETHPINAQSPYAASKVGADQLAQSFYLSFGMPVGIIRPFNTYGPRQSARAVIPTIITQINSGNKTVKLGSVLPTRDFNYIDDIVNGFIMAMNSSNSVGQTINLGSNFEISIKDTFDMIKKIMNSDVEILQEQTRLRPKKSEVERLFSDNSLAKKLISWSPKFSGKEGLEKGLIKTVEWFSNEENLKKYKSEIFNF